MLRVVSLAAMAAIAHGNPTSDDLRAMDYSYTFKQYTTDFAKVYGSAEEYVAREAVFLKNLAKIKAHNSIESTWKMGVNDYADMDGKEFAAIKNGKKMMQSVQDTQVPWSECPSVVNATQPSSFPASVDWRTKGVVTPAKNQGGCGSCWTFSTAETLESHIAIKTGKLMTFSEQEYVDCVENPDDCGGTGGCSGATQWLGFEYAMKHGMTLESEYPYKPETGTCQPDKITPVARITGYCRLPHVADNYTATQQYNDLMNAVIHYGPVAISAAAEPWQLYERGVYDGKCGADVDHAIQLVGYGTDKGILKTKDYWLVRNSWGASWGEKGYIRIERFGGSGTEKCLTDNTPGDGTACKDDPKTMQVCGLCGILSDSSYPVGGSLV